MKFHHYILDFIVQPNPTIIRFISFSLIETRAKEASLVAGLRLKDDGGGLDEVRELDP